MSDKKPEVVIRHLDGSTSVMSPDTVPESDKPVFIGWSTIAERRRAEQEKEKKK